MGMYNEVYDRCPSCGHQSGLVQIRQLVLGFGEFNIADLADLKWRVDRCGLAPSVLAELAEVLEDETFHCTTGTNDTKSTGACNHTWRPAPSRLLAIRLLANGFKNLDAAQAILREAGIED